MANYCSAEDVSILLGLDNFSSETRPTLTQVNSIISDVTNEIDFVLAGVITTQPTDARILGRLSIACKMGVACQVGLSGFGGTPDSVDNSQPDKYCRQYQAILEEIKTMPELYGIVTGDSTSFYISNQVTDGTKTAAQVSARLTPDNYEV